MKTFKYLSLRIIAVAAIAIGFATSGQAQTLDKTYANVDWQFNIPTGTDFVKKGSGWGMNFEGGYYWTDNFAMGAFLAYHSNHKYIPRQTIPLIGSGSLNTDQQHTLFQLPFGMVGRYTFNREGLAQPYFSLKLGTQYGRMETNFNVFEESRNTWGLYISPEIGLNLFPWVGRPGIHLAAYFSYASNQGKVLTYSVDHMNNFGFRIGLAF